jgi:hypothetical protein
LIGSGKQLLPFIKENIRKSKTYKEGKNQEQVRKFSSIQEKIFNKVEALERH